jgi:hypothetical protein
MFMYHPCRLCNTICLMSWAGEARREAFTCDSPSSADAARRIIGRPCLMHLAALGGSTGEGSCRAQSRGSPADAQLPPARLVHAEPSAWMASPLSHRSLPGWTGYRVACLSSHSSLRYSTIQALPSYHPSLISMVQDCPLDPARVQGKSTRGQCLSLRNTHGGAAIRIFIFLSLFCNSH